jgi:DNA-binding MarR family transcriptional regulator
MAVVTDGTAKANSSLDARLTDADYRDQANFRAALRKFLHFSEEQARAHGITPQQHLLLLMIRGHSSYPAVTVGEAAESLQIRHHSASLLVDRCVKRGLLDRKEDPIDRRRVQLSLTPEGEHVLARITLANRQEMGDLSHDLFPGTLLQRLHELATTSTP